MRGALFNLFDISVTPQSLRSKCVIWPKHFCLSQLKDDNIPHQNGCTQLQVKGSRVHMLFRLYSNVAFQTMVLRFLNRKKNELLNQCYLVQQWLLNDLRASTVNASRDTVKVGQVVYCAPPMREHLSVNLRLYLENLTILSPYSVFR